jgi:outer membrane lipoprotein SlyB
MENPGNKTHPLVIIAAVAVTAFSLVGIASVTGLIPSHKAADTPPPAPVIAAAPVAAPVTPPTAAPAPAPTAAPAAPPASAAPEAKAVVKAPVAKPHHKTVTPPKNNEPPAIPPPNTPPPATAYAPPPPVCAECGVVENIRETTRKAQPSGLGVIAGGILGGLIGNQVGGGHGRDVATVVGAIGGGFAGNEVEKSSRGTQQYQIVVRLDDGSSRVITQDSMPSWHIGDRVRLSNGGLIAN